MKGWIKYQGSLSSYLDTTDDWSGTDHVGWNLLHYACHRGEFDAVKKLVSCGFIDINKPTNADSHQTPLYKAVSTERIQIVKFLISKGANMKIGNLLSLAFEIYNSERTQASGEAMVRLLIANGLRMKIENYEPQFSRYQNYVISCRSSVVALLRVKDAGNLWKWDRFLLKEIAIQVWAMRYVF